MADPIFEQVYESVMAAADSKGITGLSDADFGVLADAALRTARPLIEAESAEELTQAQYAFRRVCQALANGQSVAQQIMDERNHYLHGLMDLLALCKNTDGELLAPEADVPVGEFLAVLTETLRARDE